MIVVRYEPEMREAFAAGQAAAVAQLMSKCKGAAECFAHTPKTYDEWIASISNRPQIAIG